MQIKAVESKQIVTVNTFRNHLRICALATLSLLSVLAFRTSTACAQGPLTPPPGAPAPVMKSLDQLEPRTPLIPGAPGVSFADGHHTSTQSGSYYLTW